MGFLDKLFKSPAEDLLADKALPVDQAVPAQETFGLPANAPASGPGAGPATAAPGTGFPGQVDAGSAQGSAGTEAKTAGPSGADDASETLDSPLRDLFTESSAIDPQLGSLLTQVEKVSARDLANELRDFSKSIGADTEPGRPEA